jgi:hypothetical protein
MFHVSHAATTVRQIKNSRFLSIAMSVTILKSNEGATAPATVARALFSVYASTRLLLGCLEQPDDILTRLDAFRESRRAVGVP